MLTRRIVVKILVTGVNGRLGIDAVNMLSKGNRIYISGKEELVISDIDNVFKIFNRNMLKC